VTDFVRIQGVIAFVVASVGTLSWITGGAITREPVFRGITMVAFAVMVFDLILLWCLQ
jgi:hypothetical protein